MTKDEMQEFERAVLRMRSPRLETLFAKMQQAIRDARAQGGAEAWGNRKRELALQWFGQRSAGAARDTSNAIWNGVLSDIEFLEEQGVFDRVDEK